jgi:putative membrane protein
MTDALALRLDELTAALVLLVAVLHVWFLILEMLLWERPLGRRVFRMTPEQAATTAVLARNQGLYNGFLAAGLVWGLVLLSEGEPLARSVVSFFLGCVVVAGVFGAATVSPRIFLVQALPALVALAVVWSVT